MESAAPNHSYGFYRRVIIIVPLLVPLVVLPTILAVKCVCGCIHNSHAQIWKKFAEKVAFGEEKKYYIHQEKPSKCIIVLLAIKGILLVMFGLALFLNESIISGETGCHTGHWDCFTIDNGHAIRITNCSNLGEFSDDSIQCYRPGFGYSVAISEVGGMLFILHILLNVYLSIYFATAPVRNRCLRVLTADFIVFAFFILAVFGSIFFATYHASRNEAETLNYKMHNILFAIFFPLIYFVVSWAMLIRSKCTFDNFDSDYDPNNVVITVDGMTAAGTNGAMSTNMGGARTQPRTSINIAQGNKTHTVHVY
jgi:hypothetical protein